MQEKEVGIYQLVKAVRNEIKKLMVDSETQREPILYLDSLDLELNIVVSKVTKAGIRFYVVSAGAEHEKEQVSRIKLSFKPIISESRVPMLLMSERDLKLLLGKQKPNETKME